MRDLHTYTPTQLARISAWIEEVRTIHQLSQAALADLIDQELSDTLTLTGRQHTILAEVQDRLRGSSPGRAPEPPLC